MSAIELSEDHKQLRSAVKKFVQEELVPVAGHYDKAMEFPWEVIRKAHANGFMNLDIPAEYGGLKMDHLSNVLISEIVSYGCSAVGVAMATNDLAATPLIKRGSEEQKKKFLTRLTAEPLMASFACTEPDAGSDISRIRTKAEKKGDEWIVNGQKCWITNAGVANFFFVLARTDPNPKASVAKAFTGFVVDADTPGIALGKKEVNLGQRASDTRVINFEDVRIPDSQRIGNPGEGGIIALQSFNKTRPHAAAFALGVAGRALDEAAKYSLERKTFGAPIAHHQRVGSN
ncbi:2-methyl branched-chain enoyl CoA reductase isoform I [Aphelenchoides avenae]|nr:2-methyl branched-chain enoyl CoA reductase isoform I [Aphelenchus avenae]